MKVLKQVDREQWQAWINQAIAEAKKGNLPRYIPLLNHENPNDYALLVTRLEGEVFSSGNPLKTFPLMSVIKPFLLLYLLSQQGQEWVFGYVGKEQSDYAFNSLIQLQLDQGFPRNSMINSGAIRLAGLLSGNTSRDRCLGLRDWLNQQGNCQLFLDETMLASVQSRPNERNQALVREMAHHGHLKNPEEALDTYNQICCLAGNIEDLAELGMLLVRSRPPLKKEDCQLVQTLMSSCGLYEASAQFAQEIGFPTKSGVSGVFLSLVPEQGAIAIYSPPLDPQGNSVAGLYLIRKIAESLR
jgi:glutaminase